MQGQTVRVVSQVIRYIEEHLQEKVELEMVASALHYSQYYLHQIFTRTVDLTIHDYTKRRQLTEAAKLLAFSEKRILEIAFLSGYESQQAFTDVFKAMYKTSPARLRETKNFYPLQLEIHLKEAPVKTDFTKADIRLAVPADADAWLELTDLAIDGYPCLDKADYTAKLHRYIADKKALILREGELAVGAMGFSPDSGRIDFWAVHPQYRSLGVAKLFLDKLADEWFCGKEIALTTYRAGDKADPGYREAYRRLGFTERELLVEYGYPTQRFVLLPENREETGNDSGRGKSVSERF